MADSTPESPARTLFSEDGLMSVFAIRSVRAAFQRPVQVERGCAPDLHHWMALVAAVDDVRFCHWCRSIDAHSGDDGMFWCRGTDSAALAIAMIDGIAGPLTRQAIGDSSAMLGDPKNTSWRHCTSCTSHPRWRANEESRSCFVVSIGCEFGRAD